MMTLGRRHLAPVFAARLDRAAVVGGHMQGYRPSRDEEADTAELEGPARGSPAR